MAAQLAAITAADSFVVVIVLLGFTIFLALQYRHFRRMEETQPPAPRDQEVLDALGRLIERVDGARQHPVNVSVDMSGLESRLDEVVRSHARLEERFAGLAERLSAAGGAIRGLGLQEMIEERLMMKGYQEVNVIDEVEGKESGEHRITIESRKGSVPYKGYVVLRNGRVIAERLQPIYEAFP